MSIVTNNGERVVWLALASRIIVELQRLEQGLSLGMADQPTSSQAIALMAADQQLGVAARALTEASAQIRGLR